MTIDEDVKEEIKDETEYWFKSSEGHRKEAQKYLNKYLKLKKENKRLCGEIECLRLKRELKHYG